MFIHLDNRLQPMIYFTAASFGTIVSRTLPYTAYRCTVFFVFFFNNSQTLLFAVAMKVSKSVNLFFLHIHVAQIANECN